MEILILYWFFATAWSFGVDFYQEKVKVHTIILNILFGWIILPISLGTARGKNLEE